MSLSLTRRRTTLDAPTVAPTEVARAIALDAVDAALRGVAGRRRFVHREATDLIDGVRRQVDEIVLGPGVIARLDGAVAGLGTDDLVDGRCVVDALLDIRLAVTNGGR
jgi:hypothetical protein